MTSKALDIELIERELAKKLFLSFVQYTKPDYQTNWHHDLLAEKLDLFARGKIKKMMVFMPPQHGKSELVSRRLPSYLLGINPNLRIIGCSYASDLSSAFNRDVQRIIDDPLYQNIFPNTTLNSSNAKTSAKGSYLRNSDIFEVVGYRGFYKSVGLGGSLTGTPADIGIIDDPVKDAVEADSPTYRARAWDWFTNVFLTRLHNDSQILVTQTRWHEDDLSGRILARMNKSKDWTVLSLPAIATHQRIEGDPRQEGQALWPEKHSLERLIEIRESNERAFHALYQQDPKPFSGGLVFSNWQIGWHDEGKRKTAFGLDFGYSPDPLALVEACIQGDNLYLREHIYKSKMETDDMVRLIPPLVPRGVQVSCDHRQELINMLFRKGVNAKPAIKGKDSIDTGIKTMQRFNIFVHPDSLNLQRELKYYRYKEDKDGNPIGGKYSEAMNHAIDAARYAVTSMVHTLPKIITTQRTAL